MGTREVSSQKTTIKQEQNWLYTRLLQRMQDRQRQGDEYTRAEKDNKAITNIIQKPEEEAQIALYQNYGICRRCYAGT